MRRFVPLQVLLPITSLTLTLACDRATPSTPPPDPSEAPIAAQANVDGAPPSEASTSAKPEGCADADDCANQGALALLAGQPAGAAMLDYACREGSAIACGNLSSALRGEVVTKDPVAAHAAAVRGCELGSAAACVDLGVDESLGLGGAAQDNAAAHQHFMIACEGNDATGCRYVGVLLAEGKLGKVDMAAALPWFVRACQMADPESCFNAGVLNVDSPSPDLEAALGFMTRACELDDKDGCSAVDQIAAAIDAQNAKVANANLHVGSATVNGLTVNELECRVEGGGMGLLGNMALIGALAERKAAIGKCGKKGAVAEVRWTAIGGKISKAEGVGSEGECVAKQLRGLATPANGECAAMIVIGS